MAEVQLMEREGRVIGENSHRIVVNGNSVLCGFQNQSAGSVCQMPVQGSQRQSYRFRPEAGAGPGR